MSAMWTGVVSRYRISYTDGTTVEVTTGMPDALRWERANKGSSLIGTNSLTTMLTLVWYALRRQQLSDINLFDEWAATVADFAKLTDEDDDEPDPTQTDQSDG